MNFLLNTSINSRHSSCSTYGANTFLANGIATFINGPTSLLNNLPKNPPDCIIFFICALLNFISVAKLLLIALCNLVFCLVVKNN